MGCTTCGSGLPCDCTCSTSLPCTTSSSGSSTDCCRPVIPASPKPFYSCAPVCEESHLQKITIQQFYASIKVVSSWNVPECGASAILDVPGLKSAVIGSYIWDEEFGYFEITAFDAAREQITIINHCNEGNAAPGTQVPACTEFVITDPPASSQNISDLCVAIDFTAPDVDNCLDIILTSVVGIVVGDRVQIGTGFYRVSAIKPNDIITICNDGEGLVPGTPVIAKDIAGDYQYCIQILATNPCDLDAIAEGIVLVCSDDIEKPLKGESVGWVLSLIDDGTLETAAYRPIGSANLCAALTSALTITAGNAGSYTLVVDDSSVWVSGDVLQIGNTLLRLTITSVTDGTHVVGTLTTNPPTTFTLPVGTVICLESCCERLQTEVDTINDETIPCVSQVIRGTLPGTFYIENIVLVPFGFGGGTFEAVVDSSVISVTVPSDCDGAEYQVTALVNVSALCDHDDGMVSHEVQFMWSNNLVNGRMSWTEYSPSDGFDITEDYPTSGDGAIYSVLQIRSGGWPNMYHGGYVLNDTIVASGGSVDLVFNYNLNVGENNAPVTLNSTHFFVSGTYEIKRL